MPSSRCGLIVGGLALGVAAVRQKSAVGSAAHAVETVSELLQSHNMGTQKLHQQLSEFARSAVTPGAEDTFKTSLQAVVTQMEDLETKIKAGYSATQEKVGTLFGSLDSADQAATAAQEVAVSKDKVWFECVASEQAKRQDVEAKDSHLTSSRSNQEEACQLQQDNRGFDFDGKGKYKMQFVCDHIKGNCREQLENWRDTVLEKMFQDAQDALTADETHHTGLKNDCETKKEIQVQAQSALDSSTGAWIEQRQQCSSDKTQRGAAMCDLGTKSQEKCAAESAFNTLLAATSQAQGSADSEVDRQSEWTAVGTTKCLLKAILAKGLDAVVTSGELETCAASVKYASDVGTLDTKPASKKIEGRNMCAARDVSFFNGQAWNVPSGVEPKSSDYTRGPFTPNINPTTGNFEFCS